MPGNGRNAGESNSKDKFGVVDDQDALGPLVRLDPARELTKLRRHAVDLFEVNAAEIVFLGARVEHVFAGLTQMDGKTLRSIGLARATLLLN